MPVEAWTQFFGSKPCTYAAVLGEWINLCDSFNHQHVPLLYWMYTTLSLKHPTHRNKEFRTKVLRRLYEIIHTAAPQWREYFIGCIGYLRPDVLPDNQFALSEAMTVLYLTCFFDGKKFRAFCHSSNLRLFSQSKDLTPAQVTKVLFLNLMDEIQFPTMGNKVLYGLHIMSKLVFRDPDLVQQVFVACVLPYCKETKSLKNALRELEENNRQVRQKEDVFKWVSCVCDILIQTKQTQLIPSEESGVRSYIKDLTTITRGGQNIFQIPAPVDVTDLLLDVSVDVMLSEDLAITKTCQLPFLLQLLGALLPSFRAGRSKFVPAWKITAGVLKHNTSFYSNEKDMKALFDVLFAPAAIKCGHGDKPCVSCDKFQNLLLQNLFCVKEAKHLRIFISAISLSVNLQEWAKECDILRRKSPFLTALRGCITKLGKDAQRLRTELTLGFNNIPDSSCYLIKKICAIVAGIIAPHNSTKEHLETNVRKYLVNNVSVSCKVDLLVLKNCIQALCRSFELTYNLPNCSFIFDVYAKLMRTMKKNYGESTLKPIELD
eukprot:CAMPEP_0206187016 /NCGR_PEP_ID=MMETSP0166-20121206/2747_1 /ASSEMBLY_ACC=CAM_ASM_000260 /TAXON_ID=95228 /ORGANISM="Vannella robusta, Strain DIVA3 518/3/11/1/6" /LENGTH=545 /DNA_ID=CAMNT_0053602511 /DNA_START=12 /DNA_END=1646 /DNA_ORIENTATION=+